jgi:hypothetical protein
MLVEYFANETEGKGEGEPLPPRSCNRVTSLSLRHSLQSQGRIYRRAAFPLANSGRRPHRAIPGAMLLEFSGAL